MAPRRCLKSLIKRLKHNKWVVEEYKTITMTWQPFHLFYCKPTNCKYSGKKTPKRNKMVEGCINWKAMLDKFTLEFIRKVSRLYNLCHSPITSVVQRRSRLPWHVWHKIFQNTSDDLQQRPHTEACYVVQRSTAPNVQTDVSRPLQWYLAP